MDQLRQATDRIEKELTRLQTLNKQLTENLRLLFEEEEIQECKNYELFKLMFGSVSEEVTTKKSTAAKSKSSSGGLVDLPSIYAPKNSRTKVAASAAAPTPAFQNQETKSESNPLDECMLPDEKHPVVVDQVEIGGKIYFFVESKFYDSTTGALVGQLKEDMIVICGEPFSLTEKKLTHVSDEYHTDGQGGVYRKCTDLIARMVGEIKDSDIYEFS